MNFFGSSSLKKMVVFCISLSLLVLAREVFLTSAAALLLGLSAAVLLEPASALMKTACLISGIVLGAIIGVFSVLFGFWLIGVSVEWPRATPEGRTAMLVTCVLWIAVCGAAGAVVGIKGVRSGHYRRHAVLLVPTASVLTVAVLWFARHVPP
jgi:hypothetical protein